MSVYPKLYKQKESSFDLNQSTRECDKQAAGQEADCETKANKIRSQLHNWASPCSQILSSAYFLMLLQGIAASDANLHTTAIGTAETWSWRGPWKRTGRWLEDFWTQAPKCPVNAVSDLILKPELDWFCRTPALRKKHILIRSITWLSCKPFRFQVFSSSASWTLCILRQILFREEREVVICR